MKSRRVLARKVVAIEPISVGKQIGGQKLWNWPASRVLHRPNVLDYGHICGESKKPLRFVIVSFDFLFSSTNNGRESDTFFTLEVPRL